jgi:hypothetical protein
MSFIGNQNLNREEGSKSMTSADYGWVLQDDETALPTFLDVEE